MLSYGEISHSFVKEIEKTSVSVDSYLHFTLQQINHSNKVILSNGAVFDRGMHKIQAIYSCWGYFNKIETYNYLTVAIILHYLHNSRLQ